jgi:hypothetical protein
VTECNRLGWSILPTQLHAPHSGKGRAEYIHDNIREQTRQQLQNYKKSKTLALEWGDRVIELAKSKAQLKKEENVKKH